MHRFIFLALLLIASPASADIQITNRSSLMMTIVDFGYVGNVTTSIDSLTYTTIDDAQLLRQGSASDGGPLGDISWDASYQFSVDQQLVPGTLGFSASGGAGLFSFAAGDGVSLLSSTNRLVVDFENTTPGDFDFSLVATPGSQIELLELGTGESVYLYSGGFDQIATILPLDSGQYRLTAETYVNTENGFATNASWSYSINAVPEPATVGLLVIGVCCLCMRRR